MKIVFMGTPDFAVPVLRMLMEEDYDVRAVVTQPDRPKGRKRTLTPPPVKEEALKYSLPVIQPEKIRNEDEWKKVAELQPDLIVTAAFGQILPKGLLDIPPLGCVNVHASLLPKYRGGAPIHQAVIDGEKETGITIMYMVEALDAGDILSQKVIPIHDDDSAGSLFERLSVLGADLLKDTLPSIEAGTIQPQKQDESLVTYAPNITKDKEIIDWSLPADSVYNQIRGLHPWPVAYTTLDGARLKVWWAEKADGSYNLEPGTIAEADETGLTITAGDGKAVKITDLQPAGKKRMDAATFFRGAGSRLKAGMKAGESDEQK
ncbi:methionyl-tRNA formyltransferase [Alteribacter natronophilus]|uniref:methionyl-tRNA formyltransferase n=1 Tax=Alteribacter natronophilus TaxID=2583810 RepID=UPI00110E2151|nr:methionyl-tRNA formyltransferase [Alteribacter natronophilus]TMW73167.1 methionyl-tRNA formyltransferase [Alteribacter natronophilus]